MDNQKYNCFWLFFYPVKITCNDKLSWYSNDPKFIIAAENLSQFSELHAKIGKGLLMIKNL